MNGNKFVGTITPQEAKYSIYRDSLGFSDFTNFDGVRLAFRGVPVVVFKLKTAINVEELYEIIIPLTFFHNFDIKISLFAKHICWPTFLLFLQCIILNSGTIFLNKKKKK